MNKVKGIYKITSPSGKVYIGQSVDINKRWKIYKGMHCKVQPALYNSFIKYGTDKHFYEVIHELPGDATQSVLNCYEQLYMDQYRACCIDLLNIREAGSIGKLPLETRTKMSKSRMGRVVSEETRVKISIGHIGKKKPKSKEHIEKVRMAVTGKKRPKEAIEATASKKRGKKLNTEQKKRLSDAHIGQVAWNKGIKMSNEFREKLRAANIGKKLSTESIKKREETKRLKGNSGFSGKNLTDEHRKNLSDAKRKKYK